MHITSIDYPVIGLFQLKDKLPEDIIEKVKYKVERDSPEDKLRDFIDWMDLVREEVLYLVTHY